MSHPEGETPNLQRGGVVKGPSIVGRISYHWHPYHFPLEWYQADDAVRNSCLPPVETVGVTTPRVSSGLPKSPRPPPSSAMAARPSGGDGHPRETGRGG